MRVLSLNELSFRAGKKYILEGITFDVNKGEIISILGSNGSGKTTLAGLIMNDFEPSSGYIEYKPDRKKFFRSVGVVYDNQIIFPYLKVSEYIDYFTAVYNMTPVDVKIFIEHFDISKIMNTQISKLSQGERMKLAIFLAIFHNPKFLMMDEPFSGVDPTIKDTIWSLIKQNSETIIMITQDWNMAYRNSDKIVFIDNGKLLIPPFDPINFKALLPASKKIVFSVNREDFHKTNGIEMYFTDESVITTFYSDSNVLDKVKSLTNSYSILDCSLKDLYLFLTKKNHYEGLN